MQNLQLLGYPALVPLVNQIKSQYIHQCLDKGLSPFGFHILCSGSPVGWVSPLLRTMSTQVHRDPQGYLFQCLPLVSLS